jgi:subtilisin family serine protease
MAPPDSQASSGCILNAPWATGLAPRTFHELGVVAISNVNTDALLAALAAECVDLVEQEILVNQIQSSTPQPVPWGLDSLDGVVDGQYSRSYTGKGVEVFVMDTGIDSQHDELLGRVAAGQDFTSDVA